MHHPQNEPTQIYIINMSAIALAKNLIAHGEASTLIRSTIVSVSKYRKITYSSTIAEQKTK